MIGMNGQSIHLSFNIYGEFFKAEERKDFSLLDHLVFKGFLALGSGYRHKIYCHPGICNSIYTSEIPKEKFSLLHYRDNLSVTKYKEATFFGLPLIYFNNILKLYTVELKYWPFQPFSSTHLQANYLF